MSRSAPVIYLKHDKYSFYGHLYPLRGDFGQFLSASTLTFVVHWKRALEHYHQVRLIDREEGEHVLVQHAF